jgi:hypothetical protein
MDNVQKHNICTSGATRAAMNWQNTLSTLVWLSSECLTYLEMKNMPTCILYMVEMLWWNTSNEIHFTEHLRTYPGFWGRLVPPTSEYRMWTMMRWKRWCFGSSATKHRISRTGVAQTQVWRILHHNDSDFNLPGILWTKTIHTYGHPKIHMK